MTDLLPTLQAFYREKLVELLSHQAAARLVGQYDFNNTYQYIINREDTQLSWVAAAITAAGGTVEEGLPEPDRKGDGRAKEGRANGLFEEDARNAQAFVDRWRPTIDALENARHQGMLRVILGLKQARAHHWRQRQRND